MRKILAILAVLIVGVLSLSMPKIAYAFNASDYVASTTAIRVFTDSVGNYSFSGSPSNISIYDKLLPHSYGSFNTSGSTTIQVGNIITVFKSNNPSSSTPSGVILLTNPGTGCTKTFPASPTLVLGTGCNEYILVDIINGQLSSSTPVEDVTRIISTDPISGETVSTSTLSGAYVYVNEDDWVDGLELRIRYSSSGGFYCANTALLGDLEDCMASGGANPIRVEFDYPLVPGLNVFSATTTFPTAGKWIGQYSVVSPYFFGIFSDELISTTTTFTQGYSTPIDVVIASTTASLANINETYFSSCNPLSSWDFMKCLTGATTYLFVPSSEQLYVFGNTLYNDVLTRFPIGYVTRFVNILSTTTSSSLPVLTATIPSILPGAGATISLDPNGVLDILLNATSGDFITPEANDTRTFYEITSYYWEIIVYIALLFYILSRIIGSHLIGNPFKYDSVDLSSDIQRAERNDNRALGRRIFRERNKMNRK